MDEQFTHLRRIFNTLKLHWVTTGDMAAYIHAKQFGFRFRNPKQFDFIISKHNQVKFENALQVLRYELITVRSSRKNLRYERRGHIPVNLHLVDSFPNENVMSYDSKVPLQKLNKLSNVNKLVNYKKKIHTMVNNLMRNINLNVN